VTRITELPQIEGSSAVDAENVAPKNISMAAQSYLFMPHDVHETL